MGLVGNTKTPVGQRNTVTLKAGMAGIKAGWFKMTNQPYLDIVMVRGRKRIARIVTKDTGFDMFTVKNLGTFLMPQGDEMQNMLYDGPGIFLFYRHDSQTAGRLVDIKSWSTFKFPPYSPEVFQKKLEAKSIADVLSEEQKDMGWLVYVAIIAVIAVVGFMVFGGGV